MGREGKTKKEEETREEKSKQCIGGMKGMKEKREEKSKQCIGGRKGMKEEGQGAERSSTVPEEEEPRPREWRRRRRPVRAGCRRQRCPPAGSVPAAIHLPPASFRLRRLPLHPHPPLPLLIFASVVLLLLLTSPIPSNSLIRNNRVILYDDHLTTGEVPRDPEEEEEFEAPERRRSEEEDRGKRKKREQVDGGGGGGGRAWTKEWRRRARRFGQSEEERARVRSVMERLKEGMSQKRKEEQGKQRQGRRGTVEEKIETEQLRELSEWRARRVSDDPSSRRQRDKGNRRATNKTRETEEAELGWPEEGGKHFEGDIVLSSDQAETIYESFARQRREGTASSRGRTKRKFIGSKVRRWDIMKPIVYSFDGSHTLREQRVIELALEHWHNITCLNFERRNDEPKGSRIVFTDVDGCASNVGRHPLGEPQFVSLAPECIRLGVIAHEVSHALGFWHEQSRPDRDLYVQVQWDNIDRDSRGQFLKEQPADVDNGGVPYDYGSIMHYRSKAFAKYDDLFTIGTAIGDYQRTIGQRDQLSFNDIRLMNEIYCKEACPRPLPCQRGGYTDPRHCDRCRCPDGFTGVLCDQVMPGYGANCGGRLELSNSWTRIASPNYPGQFRDGQECSWLLVAPPGQQVQLNFFGEFEMYCKVRHSLCMDYVEIRNSTDFANTGMRYCCHGTPEGPVLSATRDMLVLFRSFYRGGKGFQARARALLGHGQLGEWSEWGQCSASCGACGVRRRARECMSRGDAVCLGDLTQSEVCARQPCPGLCARTVSEEAPCEGLLSLLKGLRCRKERTRMEQCRRTCCAGYTLRRREGMGGGGGRGEEEEEQICAK